MIKVKLISIMINDQNKTRAFYTEVLGFAIKHDIPLGDAPLRSSRDAYLSGDPRRTTKVM